jgi:hypothetical protein
MAIVIIDVNTHARQSRRSGVSVRRTTDKLGHLPNLSNSPRPPLCATVGPRPVHSVKHPGLI